jgi:hypothetical protein
MLFEVDLKLIVEVRYGELWLHQAVCSLTMESSRKFGAV